MKFQAAISAFDLDGTLLKGNSSFQFGKYLFKEKIISVYKLPLLILFYFLHKIGFLSINSLQQIIFKRLFEGISKPLIQEKAEQFLAENFHTMQNKKVVELLKKAQKQGHFTLILSSSPDFLVSLFAKSFKVENWKATCYEVDGHLSFSCIKSCLNGVDKAVYIHKFAKEKGIALKAITAYSDSYHDIPFLEAAGNAVAVNPDRKLQKISIFKKWDILKC